MKSWVTWPEQTRAMARVAGGLTLSCWKVMPTHQVSGGVEPSALNMDLWPFLNLLTGCPEVSWQLWDGGELDKFSSYARRLIQRQINKHRCVYLTLYDLHISTSKSIYSASHTLSLFPTHRPRQQRLDHSSFLQSSTAKHSSVRDNGH